MSVVHHCKVNGSGLTWLFAVVGLNAADVPWFLTQEDVSQAPQATLELSHHLMEWHQHTSTLSTPLYIP